MRISIWQFARWMQVCRATFAIVKVSITVRLRPTPQLSALGGGRLQAEAAQSAKSSLMNWLCGLA